MSGCCQNPVVTQAGPSISVFQRNWCSYLLRTLLWKCGDRVALVNSLCMEWYLLQMSLHRLKISFIRMISLFAWYECSYGFYIEMICAIGIWLTLFLWDTSYLIVRWKWLCLILIERKLYKLYCLWSECFCDVISVLFLYGCVKL